MGQECKKMVIFNSFCLYLFFVCVQLNLLLLNQSSCVKSSGMQQKIVTTMKKNDFNKKDWQINSKNDYYGYTLQCKGSIIRFHLNKVLKLILERGRNEKMENFNSFGLCFFIFCVQLRLFLSINFPTTKCYLKDAKDCFYNE